MNSLKRLVSFLCASIMMIVGSNVTFAKTGFEICYDGGTHLYTGSVYDLYVNNSKITAEIEPIIFNDHALVPVREVFEECGATVDYEQSTRTVSIAYYDMNIEMSINDNCAYVNGEPVAIPDGVVPKLIYKPGGLTKTMVPVRFISESVGMDVGFDGDKGEIRINETDEPMATEKPTSEPITITSIATKVLTNNQIKVTLKCSDYPNGKFTHFSLKNPDRVVVDFAGADYVGGDRTIKVDCDLIPSVRTGVDSERTRIVIDVKNLEDYSVSTSSKQVIIRAMAKTEEDATPTPTVKPTAKPTATPTAKPTTTVKPTTTATPKPTSTPRPAPVTVNKTGLVQANASDKQKIIMLDAGHGGTDPGALGKLDGETINEKDLTLSITKKVKAILDSYGYKTAMTRTGDTLPSLAERPQMANQMGCAMFVSIHINSATSPDAYGTEVYYSDENNGQKYNMISQELAENVLETMIKKMGSYNRGVRMANWAVTRRSNMPAILIEVGFISNENELRKMVSSSYQDKIATGIAEGIVNSVHYIELP